jgi:hypothetical protein
VSDEARRLLRELLAEALGGNGDGATPAQGAGPEAARRGPVGAAGAGPPPATTPQGAGPEAARRGPVGAAGAGPPPATTPQVPAPPVAAVLRPSTWPAPPAPGEVIGAGLVPGGGPAPGAGPAAGGGGASAAGGARVESVRLATDDDLARFAAHVLAHADAVRSGALRFTFGPATASGGKRIDRGAVTERAVNEAAKAGGRLVLGPRAVLTPLARERARALKIQIERER